MTTTDSNGLIQYQTTDNVVPLQTTLNAISSSVSTSLNSTVRTFKVANDTERNALATTRVPSATNPLIVFNSASGKRYHEINTGSGWSRLLPANTSSQTIAPMNGWSWNGNGGTLTQSGNVWTLVIDLKRVAESFTKNNTWVDIIIIPDGVALPVGDGTYCGTIGVTGSSPCTLFINSSARKIFAFAEGSTTWAQGSFSHGLATWIA